MDSALPISATRTISVNAKIVGVVGCSASGKSTVAHYIAHHLCSPLHPISTDHFFLDDVCAELGTYDDYRCVDYSKITQWMQTLKQKTQLRCDPTSECVSGEEGAAAHDAWSAEMLSQLPGLKAYLRSSTEGNDREARGASTGNVEGKEVNDVADDISLRAHEAEDAERRANAFASTTGLSSLLYSTGDHSKRLARAATTAATPAVVNIFTVYVVWEGFTLLCNSAVNACIDYTVYVQCDPETACLRRFFRSPRRHLVQQAIRPVNEESGDAETRSAERNTEEEENQSNVEQRRDAEASVVARVVRQLYRSRIRQMWAVRSRASQRIALRRDVLEEVRLELKSYESGGVSAGVMESAERLLRPTIFNPPRPHVAHSATTSEEKAAHVGHTHHGSKNDDDAYWTDEGIPTFAFQRFWEVEFEQWLTHAVSPEDAKAMAWASIFAREGDIAQFFKQGESTDVPTVLHALLTFNEADVDNHLTGKAYVEKVLAEQRLQALTPELSRTAHAVSAGGDLAAEETSSPSTLPSAMLVAKALAPFYYEFRYWFFFEVLYYGRLLAPLQAHRLQYRSLGDASTSGSVERPWWIVKNGRALQEKGKPSLLHQIQNTVTAMLSLH